MSIIQDGFFSRSQLDAMKGIKEVRDVIGPDCQRCRLFEQARKPRMDYTGEGKKGVLILVEQPGRVEDETGIQLTGPTGDFFRLKLKVHGLELDRDFWKINSVNCYAEGKPTRTQLACCRPMIDLAIQKLKPRSIWLMGRYAVESTYMNRFSHLEIGRWRGLCIPDRDTQAWILPMYHPSFPYRNETDTNLMSVFDRDLERAIQHIGTEFPKLGGEEGQIDILTEIDPICDALDFILETKPDIFHDYETNSLKAWWPQSKILTMSIATNQSDRVISFPYAYRNHFTPRQLALIKHRVRQIMLDSFIRKRAHNLKFENMWTYNRFGVMPVSTDWCTMNTAHIIDSRKHYTGLKFQSYIHWGMGEYDKSLKPYKTGHPYNRMEEADLGELLMYGGLDSLLGERLRKFQRRIVKRDGLEAACEFRHKGLLAMGKIQENGIPINENYYRDQENRLGKRIERLEEKLFEGEEGREFKKVTGKNIDLESNKDLQHLFFDILKLTPPKETKTGYAVDEETIHKLNIPFGNQLLQLRKVRKQKNTYIAQFLREASNGKMHPFINLHIARSYRSSTSNPNFQNIPVRDEEAKKITRSGITASPGNQIVEVDYGSQEFRIGACHSKDPVMIKYIEDESTDIHRDECQKLFYLTMKQMTEALRFHSKNGFVFPEFYGSYYKLCAADLWDRCMELETGENVKVYDHLKNVGIIRSDNTAYGDFEEHVRNCEGRFWEMLEVHNEWQQRMIREYQKKGYVETFFGFRRGGYLSNNKIKNTPVQADAYLCLEWTITRLTDIAEEEGWRSKIMGQIHDSIVFDAYPNEVQHLLQTVKRVATEEIRNRHRWIIVPLSVEVEMSKVGESWYEKEEIDGRGYGVKSKELKTWEVIEW